MVAVRLFVVSLLITLVNCNCRDGWVRFHGSCYLFRETPKENWHDAENYCTAIKTHLVEIDDLEENNFLKAEIKLLNMNHGDCFWTDGNDFETEGTWVWAQSLTQITETYWTPGEPNSVNSTKPDEDCINLAMWQNLGWNDEHCDRHCSFVCEME